MNSIGLLRIVIYMLLLVSTLSARVFAANNDPTAEEAGDFLTEAEARLEAANHEYAHAAWLAATYINYDSQIVEALAYQRFLELSV